MPGNKNFLYFSFIVCLLFRINHEMLFPQLESDYAVQVEAAKNVVHGHGFSNVQFKQGDLSTPSFVPLRSWPVGYPLLLVLCYGIVHSWIWAQILLQCISVTLLLFAFKKLFDLLGIHLRIQSLSFLWLAFLPTPFFYSGTSDLLSVSFFLFILYYTFQYFKRNHVFTIELFFLSVLVFLCTTIRFACIPNVIIAPLAFLLVFIFKRKIIHLQKSALVFGFSVIFVFLFYWLFPIASDRTGFAENLLNGDFYFSHLRWFDPFPVKAFFFTRPLEFRLPEHAGLLRVYRYGLLLAGTGIVFYSLYYLYKNAQKNGSELPESQYGVVLFTLFVSTFIVITGFITLQSLTTPPESNSFGPGWMPALWTFVYSTRYFIWLIVFIQLIFIICLNDFFTKKSKTYKGYKVVAYSVFWISFCYGVFYCSFVNYQFWLGNGAGSDWVEWKHEFDMIRIADREIKDNKTTVYLASYLRDGYDGSILHASRGIYLKQYTELLKEISFPGNHAVFYVFIPAENLSEEEIKFSAAHASSLFQRMSDGNLYRIIK